MTQESWSDDSLRDVGHVSEPWESISQGSKDLELSHSLFPSPPKQLFPLQGKFEGL